MQDKPHMTSIGELVEEAEKAGEAPPTVERFLRRLAFPEATVPVDQPSDSYHNLLDGNEQSTKRQTILGLYHRPQFGSILSEAGLSYLVAQSRMPPDTPLTSILSLVPEERSANRFPTGVSSLYLRLQSSSHCPELVPPEAGTRLFERLFNCGCLKDGLRKHSCGFSPVKLKWNDRPADEVIDFLGGLSSAAATSGVSLFPWEGHSFLEATNPWTRLNEVSRVSVWSLVSSQLERLLF